ncbi:uncharacterized protein LOC123702933 isoform X1 [Colias croceus]|uniref:uncharacterized protein LOC123702933 isoform X1 n=1 Tax=Colias crocea TaxID=72248 RepID=UPI001E28068E|nr:uncharacterized protein LOC123702933 isoform X1 [Colias croceus]
MKLKCCVGGCDATKENNRLFCFPKIDSLRNLWLNFIVPRNPHLIGLSKEQLRNKRVCEKHFDKHQFDGEGKRIRYSYPCLFRDEEIACGEPLAPPGTVYDALSDHNYCKEYSDDENEDLTNLVVGRAGEGFNDHLACVKASASEIDIKGEDSNYPTFSSPIESYVCAESIHIDTQSELIVEVTISERTTTEKTKTTKQMCTLIFDELSCVNIFGQRNL